LAFAVGGVGQTAIAARMLASGVRSANVWIKLALGIADVSTTAVEEYVRGNPDTEFSRMWIENRDIIYPVLLAANLTDAVITTYINRVRQLEDAFFRETGREIGTAVARGGRVINEITDATRTHILRGTINPSGQAVGVHSQSALTGGTARIRPNTTITEGPNNMFRAYVDVRATNGNWIPKTRQSTFFPRNWNDEKILREVENAFRNRVHTSGNTYRGLSSEGITIEMYLKTDGTREIISAFPIF